MFLLLSKCIQRKQLLALKTYISPPRLGYSSDLGVVGMGWGRGLWDKDDKAERLLKSPPWVQLLGVYDGTSVTEFLQEAHLTWGIWWRRRLNIRGVHQSSTSERWEKARHSKYTSQDVGGCSQALVTAARVTSKRAALLYHSKGTRPAGRTVHTMLCQLRLVSNLYKPRGLPT